MQRFNPLLHRPGRKTGIAPAVLQAHLDSAANAGAKGQAQYNTPIEWAKVLSQALPRFRHTVVDFTCGHGQLLSGTAGPSTNQLLGADIEPPDRNSEMEWSAAINDRRVTGDITLFYPLLHELDFEADLFVLNPPWDLHWYRDRLTKLAESSCLAVQVAFAAHDGRTSKDTIDSTVATLCMALDRCSVYGEGVLIANNATLDRLIFAPDAPHAALAPHVWARCAVQGNICDRRKVTMADEFFTGIIYFARGHNAGARGCRMFDAEATVDDVRRWCEKLEHDRNVLRQGARCTSHQHSTDTAELWNAAAEEWRVRSNAARVTDNPWNVWLGWDGSIRTNLSVFDERTNLVKKSEAVNLHKLNGRHPMALVLQKEDRRLLERVTFGDVWRVAPAVTQAVRQALVDYDAVRAPLTKLNKIQRLGYLDDNEDILCLKSFGPFTKGERYALRTTTMPYKRAGEKMNLYGQYDSVQWDGSELAIYIGERLFMDARLRANDVRLQIEEEGDDGDSRKKRERNSELVDVTQPRRCPIHHTLQELVEHFEIPEVPCVAERDPEGYNRNLEMLTAIEEIVNRK